MGKPNRHGAAHRGWSNSGGHQFTPADPLRNGCTWNNKEDLDLLEAYTSGVSVQRLAELHQRKVNAVETRLFSGRALRAVK